MFRILQGIPRALRNKAQVGYTTHQRSPSTTQQGSHQDDGLGLGLPNRPPPSASSTALVRRHIACLHTASRKGKEDKRHQDDWNSFKKHNHWQSFRGAHNHYEAVGWGTAIIISLQLCRGLSTVSHPDNPRRHPMRNMITSIAHAMPQRRYDMSMSVIDERKATTDDDELLIDAEASKPKQNDSSEALETSAELNEALQKLQAVSEESIGMAHNAMGLHEARHGNLHTAAEHFMKGSLQGYSKAQFNMAVCYEQGRGVMQDCTKAVELYQSAASHGHVMAQYNLGVFYLLGRGDAVIDTTKALELISEAADQGLTQAQSYLGTYYMKEPHQNTEKAVALLKQAAMKQDTEALYHLGVCYHHGLGIECNTAKAASYYHKSAEKGYVPALYSLAMFYEQGLGGLPKNIDQAEDLYRRASHKGCKEAKLKLKQIQQRKLYQQKGTNFQETKQATTPKCNTEKATLKRTKTQTSISSSPIHTSASEPVLRRPVTSGINGTNTEHSGKDMKIAQQLSYLSLFLPYYFNITSKSRSPAITNFARGEDEMSQRSRVIFQVGEEIVEESEVAGCSEPVSRCLNTLGGTPFLTVS